MGKQPRQGRRKGGKVTRASYHPSLASARRLDETLPDRRIVLENIDAGVVGMAELDALEHYFGDVVERVLGR